MATALTLPVPKQDGHFHVTIVTKDELQQLTSEQQTILRTWMETYVDSQSDGVIELGTGCDGKRSVFYRLMSFPAGAEIRRRLDMPWKDFHVTVSAKNDHSGNLCRGVDSILLDAFNNQLSEKEFDTSFLLYMQAERKNDAYELAIRFRRVNQSSPVAHIRFADSALSRDGHHKIAMLGYMSTLR